MAKHVAVLMGGFSSERPVSLASGQGLRRCTRDGRLHRHPRRRHARRRDRPGRPAPDVAFNALHGPYGEDGTIQGILEYLQIPYTHSGVLASALSMHKERAKIVAKAAGIPVADAKVMHRLDAAVSHVMPPPYVVKPVAEGSSFGVLIVREDQPTPPQQLYANDWPYGDIVMVERFVHGRELTCAVMGDVALEVCEIITGRPRLLRLRFQICARRLAPCRAGRDPEAGVAQDPGMVARRPAGDGLPRHLALRLPL